MRLVASLNSHAFLVPHLKLGLTPHALSLTHTHTAVFLSLSLLSFPYTHTRSSSVPQGSSHFLGRHTLSRGPGWGVKGGGSLCSFSRSGSHLQIQVHVHACMLEACSMPPRIACPGLQCSPRPPIACALALILTCAWTVTIRGGARHVLFVYGAPPKSAVSLKPQPINHVQAAGDTKVGTTHLCDLRRAHLTIRRHCVIERDGYRGEC